VFEIERHLDRALGLPPGFACVVRPDGVIGWGGALGEREALLEYLGALFSANAQEGTTCPGARAVEGGSHCVAAEEISRRTEEPTMRASDFTTRARMLAGQPRVGLGCMGMSEFYGPSDDDDSLRALLGAFDLGYRHFDTADMYGSGHNERLLGRFLRELGARRADVRVATKCGIRRRPAPEVGFDVDGSPAYVRSACDASLARLGVDEIDLFYLHRRSPSVPIEETVGAMGDLVRAGKVRAIGLSEVSEATLRAAAAVHPIAALQSEYSLWTRDAERGVLHACDQLGVDFVAYSPLGRGFLSGEVTPERLEENAGDLRRLLPRFAPGNIEANASLLAALRAVASEVDASPAQVALAWVLAQGDHVHVIPGARRPSHVADNFRALRVALTDGQREGLARAFAPANVRGARYPEALMRTVDL
jgi:aryl-alcohol dehydrogenase-like predicted oxidoreductase